MRSFLSSWCLIAIGLLVPNCGNSSDQSSGSSTSANDCKLSIIGNTISLTCNGVVTSTIQVPAGTQGQKGDKGDAGTTGAQGSAGINSLVAQSTLSAGNQHCPAGGLEIDSGLDTNGDGKLEASEITSTNYVCNGAQGQTGATGPQGPAGDQWQYWYSGSRLQITTTPIQTLVGDDGSKYTTPAYYTGFYDTTLGVNCSLGLASDGKEHCLPSQYLGIFSFYYTDNACKNPVAYYVYANSCGAAAPQYIKILSTSCPTTYSFYQLGNAVTTIYYLSGTTCTAYPNMSDLLAVYQFYQVGNLVPASTFVSFTQQ